MLEFRNRAISTGSRNPEKKNGRERENRERGEERGGEIERERGGQMDQGTMTAKRRRQGGAQKS